MRKHVIQGKAKMRSGKVRNTYLSDAFALAAMGPKYAFSLRKSDAIVYESKESAEKDIEAIYAHGQFIQGSLRAIPRWGTENEEDKK